MRFPDIQVGECNERPPAHKIVQQDLDLQRCEQRIKDKIKRLRKALNDRTVSHTASATLAGIEIRSESDSCGAEERLEETKQPSLTPCALAQR